MRVTFLGTGSAMMTADRAQTGLLVEDDDRTLLIDCGSGVLRRLQQSKVGYEGVEHLLLSHHHLDHIADLLPLMKARWLAGEESLTVVGPPGTEELVEGLLDVHEYMQDRLELTVRDEEPASFEVGGFEIEAMETRHSMRCHAYRVGEEFCFSGDSEAFAELTAFADGCEVLVHDCSFPDEVDVSNHPTPGQLGAVLTEIDIGTVYLSHLYPHTDDKHEEMLDSMAEHYDGEVRVGKDLDTVRI